MAKKKAPKASKPRKTSMQSKQSWKLLEKGATIAGAVVATRLTAVTWHAATGKHPPHSTRDPELRTAEAIAFAVVTGVVVELTKVLINRKAVDYWIKSTGELPPGMRKKDRKKQKEATGASFGA